MLFWILRVIGNCRNKFVDDVVKYIYVIGYEVRIFLVFLKLMVFIVRGLLFIL